MGVIERVPVHRLPSVSRRALKRFAVASLVANMFIIVSGGAVRLTASGLGCPTWPTCTDESFVPHGELGLHGAIEFGNRMLTFVLAAVAIATWLATMRYEPRRRSLRVLATVLAIGIPAQAVIGGFTVLTDLNPYVVAFHLLVSLAMVGVAVVFLRRIDEDDLPPRLTVPDTVAWVARATFVTAWVVLYVGTIVTGSGPHAGDLDARRTGLDPETVSQIHADLVFLLVGLTIGTLVGFRVTGAPERAVRAASWLLGIELAQGVLGFVQYFTDLPEVLVGMHMFGAACVSAAATWMLLGIRDRGLAAR
jgi:cytochrome c oxidase assembly protein subunit 15